MYVPRLWLTSVDVTHGRGTQRHDHNHDQDYWTVSRCADFCTETAEQVADAYLTTEEDCVNNCTGRRLGTLFTGP